MGAGGTSRGRRRPSRSRSRSGARSSTRAVRDLGLVFGDRGTAVALNDRGQVIGRSGAGNWWKSHAFVWENGKMTDLGTLPGGRWSQAVAINNRGQILGWSSNSGQTHIVLWTLKR